MCVSVKLFVRNFPLIVPVLSNYEIIKLPWLLFIISLGFGSFVGTTDPTRRPSVVSRQSM